jgi:hypothetical protein
MKTITKIIILSFTIFLIFSLIGCSNKNSVVDNPEIETGMLNVKIPIPDQFASQLSVQSITDNISLSKLKVTITSKNTNESKSKEVEINNDSVNVGFGKLATDTWLVEVEAIDEDGNVVYTGSDSVTISFNTVTNVTIDLSLTPADLNITINFLDGQGISSGTVELIDPVNGNQLKNLSITNTQGTASFEDVQAKTWPIKVVLKDSSSNIIFSGEEQIPVMPGKTTIAEINCNNGTLEISVKWEIAPSEPTELNGMSQDGDVKLTWNANSESNIVGYMVYRSKYQDGDKQILTDSLVTNNSYTDSDVNFDEKYWYWVQAYNTDGVTSDLSVSTSVTVMHERKNYFPTSAGYGIEYHVTDEDDGEDANYWVISQGPPEDNYDFVFTVSNVKDANETSVIGGITDSTLTYCQSGMPGKNQGSIYYHFSLLEEFNSGDSWTNLNKEYTVEYIGSQTINGDFFNDCIKINVNSTAISDNYLSGTGYFILARGIGIVKINFVRDNGDILNYDYISNQQFTSQYNILGTVTEGGNPVEGINVSYSTKINFGQHSVTNSNGDFSINIYGPSSLLWLGYDYDSNGEIDSFDPGKTYPINNIDSDISNVNIELNDL